MQGIGSKEDTQLSREDLTLRSRELPVESLGHCQSIGNWIAFLATPDPSIPAASWPPPAATVMFGLLKKESR
jgi:hypothetical protein